MISRYSHAADVCKREMRKVGKVQGREQYQARRALKCACKEVKIYREGSEKK